MTANKEKPKRGPIFDLDIFRLGDYSDIGRFEFGEKEFEQIRNDFFERKKSAGFSGVDIVISTDEADPHNKNSFVPVGKATDIYLKKNGTVAANGYYLREYAPKIKELSGKSAGLIEKAGKGWTVDHVLVCPTDRAIIQDLTPNAVAMYAEGIPKKVEYVGSQEKINKEQNMPNEAMFSQSDVELKVRDAEDKIKQELTANFAAEKAEIEAQLTQKDEVITGLNTAVGELKAQVANFAQKEEDKKVERLETRVDGIKGITAEQKEALKGKIVGFARSKVDGKDDAIEMLLSAYEGKPPLVQEGEEPGDRGPREAEFADPDKPVTIKTPTRAEYEEWKLKEGK